MNQKILLIKMQHIMVATLLLKIVQIVTKQLNNNFKIYKDKMMFVNNNYNNIKINKNKQININN